MSFLGAYSSWGKAIGLRSQGEYVYLLIEKDWTGMGGLRIVDISNPSNISVPSDYFTYYRSNLVAVHNNYIHIKNYLNRIYIYKIENTGLFSQITSYPTPGSAKDFAFVNDYAFIADSNGGCCLYNFSDINHPIYVTSRPLNEACLKVKVDGNYLFAVHRRGLVIFDIGTIYNPVQLSEYTDPGNVYDFDVNDTLGFLATYPGGLKIFDLSDCTNPIEISTTPFQGQLLTLAYKNNHIFAGGFSNGMTVFDVSDPYNPSIGSSVLAGNRIDDLKIVGKFAYLQSSDRGVNVVDISNPDSSKCVGYFTHHFKTTGIYYSNNELFQAVLDSGLYIFSNDLLPTSVERDFTHMPKDICLYQNYPNPYNPFTKIQYTINKTSNVKLRVYDILGKEIITLINEEKLPGTYEIKFDGSNYSSGIYFYRIETGEYAETKKMLLLK